MRIALTLSLGALISLTTTMSRAGTQVASSVAPPPSAATEKSAEASDDLTLVLRRAPSEIANTANAEEIPTVVEVPAPPSAVPDELTLVLRTAPESPTAEPSPSPLSEPPLEMEFRSTLPDRNSAAATPTPELTPAPAPAPAPAPEAPCTDASDDCIDCDDARRTL